MGEVNNFLFAWKFGYFIIIIHIQKQLPRYNVDVFIKALMPFSVNSDIKIIFQSPYLVSAMKIEENISIRRACQPSTSVVSPPANERAV